MRSNNRQLRMVPVAQIANVRVEPPPLGATGMRPNFGQSSLSLMRLVMTAFQNIPEAVHRRVCNKTVTAPPLPFEKTVIPKGGCLRVIKLSDCPAGSSFFQSSGFGPICPLGQSRVIVGYAEQ